MGEHHQSVENPNRTKSQTKGEFLFLLELGHPSFPAPGHQSSWVSGFQTRYLILVASSSQVFELPLTFLDACQCNDIKTSRSRNMLPALQQNKENSFKGRVPSGIKLLSKMSFLPLDLILHTPQGLILLLLPIILDIPTLTIFTYIALPNKI